LHKISFIVIYFLLLSFIPACSIKEAEESNIITIAIESNPTNLDPRFSMDAVSSKVTRLLFNGLVKRDENMRLIPDLAEKWEMTDDVTYLFHLKKGIKFHNGIELTSKDVQYTYEFILDPATKSPKRGGYDRIKEIKMIFKYLVYPVHPC